MLELMQNKHIVWIIMAVSIFIVTQLVKLPYKAFITSRLSERWRKIANYAIMAFAFGLSVAVEALYSTYITFAPFDWVAVLATFCGSQTAYNGIAGFLKSKHIDIDNPFNTEEGEAATKLAKDVLKDGKVDNKDTDPIKEFWKQVK